MLKEDIANEMKTASADDAAAQEKYLADRAELKKVLDAQIETKVAYEKELAELKATIAAKEEGLDQANKDMDTTKELSEAKEKDCAWVKTHFDSRKEKREKEIDGLQDAKAILAGSAEDDLGA